MRIKRRLIEKPIAACMVLLLAAPVARAEPLPGQEAAAAQENQGSPPTATQQAASAPNAGRDSASGSTPEKTAQSPDVDAPSSSGSPSPGAEAAQTGDQNAPANDSQTSDSQASQTQDQSAPAKPVGTAAAPAVKSTGVAGSRVSGAAIAPGKQRRVRTFLISIAVVVAACVAVGTVVALTHATPSQPR
jgi:hypothetical protein